MSDATGSADAEQQSDAEPVVSEPEEQQSDATPEESAPEVAPAADPAEDDPSNPDHASGPDDSNV